MTGLVLVARNNSVGSSRAVEEEKRGGNAAAENSCDDVPLLIARV